MRVFVHSGCYFCSWIKWKLALLIECRRFWRWAGEREMKSKMRESPARCGRLGRSATMDTGATTSQHLQLFTHYCITHYVHRSITDFHQVSCKIIHNIFIIQNLSKRVLNRQTVSTSTTGFIKLFQMLTIRTKRVLYTNILILWRVIRIYL